MASEPLKKKKKRNLSTSGLQCFAINCVSYRNRNSKKDGISFHQFPDRTTNRELYDMWVRNCRREVAPGESARVCSKHFKDDMINRTMERAHLQEGAVPTIFDLPDRLQHSSPRKRTTKVSQLAMQDLDVQPLGEDDDLDQQEVNMDHSYILPPPDNMKDRLLQLQAENEGLRKELRNAKLREHRAKHTMEDLLQQLTDQNMVNAELEMKLSAYTDIPCELFQKPAGEYSQRQRNFALTLHLYSAKAYEYLRKTMHINLPSPRSLRRWLESVDGEPGLNQQMLKYLQLMIKEVPHDYTHCCFMLDAMSIKQMIEFDQKKQVHTGYVDLGDGSVCDDMAKEVLVFMVVGLRGHWKAPIAYFLTKTLTAEVQARLVLHALEELTNIGALVHTITMDGHATNIAMAKILGARLTVEDKMKPYIQVENSRCKTFFILDPCHMVKLARNTLHDYGGVYSSAGQVLWQHIQDLHEVQEDIGLRFGNKVSRAHMHFATQKMKVSLAVQVLSESVAAALETLRRLGMSKFSLTQPTEEFIRNIDCLFDILNSRSSFGKAWKAPLREDNWVDVKSKLLSVKQYLLDLRTTSNGLPLHKSPRGTCILGLCVDIESICGLVEEVLGEDLEYLLCYKFSQDHIELFFSAVRQCGGWMNNPTAQQFKWIFRRLSACAGNLQVAKGANVSSLDDTALLQAHVPCVQLDEHEEDSLINTHLDHAYTSQGHLGPLIGNIVTYISGWVVKKLLGKITCSQCRELLVSEQQSLRYGQACTLLNVKNHGGLLNPSDGVITILGAAERHIRHLTGLKVSRHSHLQLERLVLADVEPGTLRMDAHAMETSAGIDNHFFDVVRALVQVYFNIRSHHIVRLHNESVQGKKMRQKYNKMLLFKGQ